MKMKFWDRLILRFGAFVTLCAGAVSLAAGILLFGKDLGDGTVMKIIPYALIVAGALAIIISALNVLVARRYAARRRAFVTQPTELGELRIAVSAIENLILKCVETHKEVKVQDMRITNRHGAVNVELRVSMNSNVSIPHAVEQLQSQIKRYLLASSGIEVREITVSVDQAVGDESALPTEPLAAAAPEKEEKIPMHQRIFGRDPEKSEAEQIAEAEAIPQPEGASDAVLQEEPVPETAEAEMLLTDEAPDSAPAAEDANQENAAAEEEENEQV